MAPPRPVTIAGRPIGPDQPPYLIAEIGINHNGDPALAGAMLRAAAESGADAVKFQAFTPERLFNPLANPAAVDLFRQWTLTRDDFRALKAQADSLKIPFLCTPFDPGWTAFLEQELDVPAFKIASSDCVNPLLLNAVGQTGKPVILSTGMATLDEVEAAVALLEAAGCPGIVILHCVTQYPPAPEEMNLQAIGTMRAHFPWPIGFSDHWTGPLAALGAVAQGACLIEKHFTTDRALPGPDQAGSADPAMLAALAADLQTLWTMQGDGVKRARGGEEALRSAGRPGLYAARDLPAGTILTAAEVYAARPCGATPAALWPELEGSVVKEAIAKDCALASPDRLVLAGNQPLSASTSPALRR